jgi:CHAT domain-containing protein
MRLVFLSACEAGLTGVLKLAEECIGLGAGFVMAGAVAELR